MLQKCEINNKNITQRCKFKMMHVKKHTIQPVTRYLIFVLMVTLRRWCGGRVTSSDSKKPLWD